MMSGLSYLFLADLQDVGHFHEGAGEGSYEQYAIATPARPSRTNWLTLAVALDQIGTEGLSRERSKTRLNRRMERLANDPAAGIVLYSLQDPEGVIRDHRGKLQTEPFSRNLYLFGLVSVGRYSEVVIDAAVRQVAPIRTESLIYWPQQFRVWECDGAPFTDAPLLNSKSGGRKILESKPLPDSEIAELGVCGGKCSGCTHRSC